MSQSDSSPKSKASVTIDVSVTDQVLTPQAKNGLFVGGAGTVTVRECGNNADSLFTGVLAGTILPIQVAIVRHTGTSATNMRGLL